MSTSRVHGSTDLRRPQEQTAALSPSAQQAKARRVPPRRAAKDSPPDRIDQIIASGKLDAMRTATDRPRAAGGKTAVSAVGRMVVDGVAYRRVSGRPVSLVHGSMVEGSLPFGGIQPNYVIDLKHPALQPMFAQIRALQYRPMPMWEKVDAVMEVVRKTLSRKAYRSPPYLRLLAQHRRAGTHVSLGEYADQRCGVCREHALLTHLALQQAGVKTKYAYVKATQGDRVEDHAIVTIHHGGQVWVLDSYNRNFNGGRVEDFLKPGGSRPADPRLPFADPAMFGCSFQYNAYPAFWLPEPGS
jgi:hypothetical protein